MNDDPSNSAMTLDEQLVAYLDGELDHEASRRIEELLATNAEVRRRLQEMERTWDLLDDLDTAPAGGRFTESTLEMVAVAARKDVEQSLAEAPRRRQRRALAVGGSLLAAVVAGFLAVVLLLPDPNRQLLQDLPVLENLDQYRQIDDIEFLQMLRNEGLFSKENDKSPSGDEAPPDESLAQRRQRVENMNPSEQEQLARLQDRFIALDRDQRKRLQRLDEAIQGAADARQLRQVMRRYCEWLTTLPSYTRAELAELAPADRIKAVETRLDEQAREGRNRLGGKDADALLRWMNGYATRHAAQLLESLPEPQRKKLAELSPPMRQRMVFWQMWQRWQAAGPGQAPPLATDDDLKRLREQLTPETRKLLETKPAAEQWQLVAGWMRHAARQHAATRAMHGPLPKADDERLMNFFENKLPDPERDRLLGLPGEEMQRELQRLYLRAKPFDGPGRRPDGSRHGNWPGGERPAPNRPEREPRPEP